MMTCPTIDQLSRYVDGLTTAEESVWIRTHLEECESCQEIAEHFHEENRFIHETLKSPTLPKDFTETLMKQLTPYKKKRKKMAKWSWIAASLLLIGFISASFHPTVAKMFGGVFSTEYVDGGIQRAAELNQLIDVDFSVTDQGLTLAVDEMLVDRSRAVLSYQIMKSNGEILNVRDIEGEMYITNGTGNAKEDIHVNWQNIGDYGLLQYLFLSLDEIPEHLTLHFDVTKINSHKGQWALAVPIEIDSLQDDENMIDLMQKSLILNDVQLTLQHLVESPSLSTLTYEAAYTKAFSEQIQEKITDIENKTGINIETSFIGGPEIAYQVLNEKGEMLYENDRKLSVEEETHGQFVSSSGTFLPNQFGILMKDSFVKETQTVPHAIKLTAIRKVLPVNFAVNITSADVKKEPTVFHYEDNSVTLNSIEMKSDYYFKKSILPIGKQSYIRINLTEQNPSSTELGTWLFEDEAGRYYETYSSGSSNDRSLYVYGLGKVPKQFTLHLVSKTVYEEISEKVEF